MPEIRLLSDGYEPTKWGFAWWIAFTVAAIANFVGLTVADGGASAPEWIWATLIAIPAAAFVLMRMRFDTIGFMLLALNVGLVALGRWFA